MKKTLELSEEELDNMIDTKESPSSLKKIEKEIEYRNKEIKKNTRWVKLKNPIKDGFMFAIGVAIFCAAILGIYKFILMVV